MLISAHSHFFMKSSPFTCIVESKNMHKAPTPKVPHQCNSIFNFHGKTLKPQEPKQLEGNGVC